ncbi:MAG TPA: helix-turn-helix domain-containing protein [Candidatus Saccharimonadales bacterium]|nr:helix-turn-helix domain-containing protein [Candidatus Saccharimonadales bacterium]
MKRLDRKSDCAINYSLEAIGDPWSLLIVRDIVYYGKKTYGEFLAAKEGIATAALARRLLDLENKGIIVKQRSTVDKRKEDYTLTEKGLDLIPILLDLAEWGAEHDPETGAIASNWTALVKANKHKMASLTRQIVKAGGSVFDTSGRLHEKLR